MSQKMVSANDHNEVADIAAKYITAIRTASIDMLSDLIAPQIYCLSSSMVVGL